MYPVRQSCRLCCDEAGAVKRQTGTFINKRGAKAKTIKTASVVITLAYEVIMLARSELDNPAVYIFVAMIFGIHH
eukprot:344005-Pyramimonas_sp.AAC.1